MAVAGKRPSAPHATTPPISASATSRSIDIRVVPELGDADDTSIVVVAAVSIGGPVVYVLPFTCQFLGNCETDEVAEVATL
jgi:hypothetical protein